jgi:hypothetical protein
MPFLRALFQFALLHPDDLLLALAVGTASILWFEGLKLIHRRRNARHAESE